MKRADEMTRGYQLRYMIVRQMLGLVICAIIQFLIFIPSYGNDIFRTVSGILFTVVNFCIVYDTAAVLGKSDSKTYSVLKYSVRYSLLWGLAIGVLNILTIVLFFVNWRYGAVDGVLATTPAIIYNLLFYILQSPYIAYLMTSPQTMPIFVMILSVFLPIVASVLGYICGRKEFTISDRISKIMFEKDSKDI